METGFLSFIRKQDLFSPGDRILLAVSGGIDSVVMSHLFASAGYHFGIAHCNFNLRGNESDADEQFVAGLARTFNVPFHLKKFDTTTYARKKGISVQMAARDLRYEWFGELCKDPGYRYIATGHHLDDQVETFFINLIRGTGISGLHGILPKQGNLIRPLLFAYRHDIDQYAIEKNIQYRNDSSNDATKYTRNKIRHELLPVLREMNPEFAVNLTNTILRLRDIDTIASTFIDRWKDEVISRKGDTWYIDSNRLGLAEPKNTLAWELFSPFGFTQSQVQNILSVPDTDSRKLFLSPGYRAVKHRRQIIIQPLMPLSGKKRVIIRDFITGKSLRKPIRLRMHKVNNAFHYVIEGSNHIANLDAGKLEFPLVLRQFRPGDIFYPFGMNKKKKLSDFLINEKLSLPEKENTWLLCSGSKIVWVVGRRIDHRFRITSRTTKILRIEYIP
ncbi:MAG TPA: tRNA lysidine(34) synthetase TilS [Bacteroidales bacterium]|nr:tRNA lysidine(34) synthetase TilS [Bacteroidales bacterium]